MSGHSGSDGVLRSLLAARSPAPRLDHRQGRENLIAFLPKSISYLLQDTHHFLRNKGLLDISQGVRVPFHSSNLSILV